MTIPVAWIREGWICSGDPHQNARYWVHRDAVWGPDGASDIHTGYWISDGWIYGPAGAKDVRAEFFIRDGWIYGPRAKLPFVE